MIDKGNKGGFIWFFRAVGCSVVYWYRKKNNIKGKEKRKIFEYFNLPYGFALCVLIK